MAKSKDDVLKTKILSLALQMVESAQGDLDIKKSFEHQTMKAREASEQYTDPNENFDGYLSITLNLKSYFDFSESELTLVRNACRVINATNEIVKNIQHHYQNFIVGTGITARVLKIEELNNTVAAPAQKVDNKQKTMLENWQLFSDKNKLHLRCRNWVERVHREGEVFLRLFKSKDVPALRFIDPAYIQSENNEDKLGCRVDPNDEETVQSYFYKDPVTQKGSRINADEIFHDKRNVDIESYRGISTFWPIITNLRRAEKILVNVSALTAVQSAIAMVRQYETATGAQVASLLAQKNDSATQTDTVTGKSKAQRRLKPGTVLDAPKGVTYEFPSHAINSEQFTKAAQNELSHISAGVVLPVSWLLAEEPTESLTPGSPVVANFRTEQAILFHYLEEIFWKVQEMMGLDAEKLRAKYVVVFAGPRLAVSKAIDEVRVDETLMRMGALSPQTVSTKYDLQFDIERAQTLAYRATMLPDESLPGDVTTPNAAGGTGETTKTGAIKKSDGQGGKV